MHIFANTSDLTQLAHYRQLGLIAGVTTNPSICAANTSFANPMKLLGEIITLMQGGYVFVQVLGSNPQTQMEEAKRLSALGPSMVIKVVMDKVGMQSIPMMVAAGLQVAATAVNSVGRLLAAAQCGAHYAIPYYGWLEDSQENPSGLVQDMADICHVQGLPIKLHVLCRRSGDIRVAARAGVWGVLLDPPDLERFFSHPPSDVAVAKQVGAWAGRFGAVTWLDLMAQAS